MKQIRILAVLASLLAPALSPVAAAQVKGYHFVYTVSDRRAEGAPTQVFHDGKRTYFQFARGVQTPVILIATPSGEQLANPVAEDPYVVVQGVHDRFAVVSGRVRIDVSSNRAVAVEQASMAYPAREPVAMNGGRAVPLDIGGRANDPSVSGNSYRYPTSSQQHGHAASVLGPVVQAQAMHPPVYAPPHATQQSSAISAPVVPVVPLAIVSSTSHAAEERLTLRNDMRVALGSRMPLVRAGDVETIGTMPKQSGLRARGTGTLREAVEHIVPSNFKGFEVGGVDVEQQVSWYGNGRPWINVLRDVMTTANVRAVVNFDNREITLHRVSSKPGQLAQLRNAAVSAPVTSTLASALPAPVPEWALVPETDKTLSRALARWVELAGWQLAWDAQIDYPLDLRASFSGSFEEAINKVATSLATAERPLHFTFYDGNKVLRVSGSTPATPYAAK